MAPIAANWLRLEVARGHMSQVVPVTTKRSANKLRIVAGGYLEAVLVIKCVDPLESIMDVFEVQIVD